ncbi:hypothetical protein Q428_08675 [Fervidicella metallireducens AeB]|uniref:LysM domain-containing protein n=1 Tax=Fervidicella metallireducens AeB TaxID=1403537 RepID=A0A017RV10_9CLOT|nr:LysM peptidoglycan-binding domain-containing protein [Fervidicella metallireducens]EYE88264.1 hypothetical protein Q428_08675 [Fervidicella metallireducens AeB]
MIKTFINGEQLPVNPFEDLTFSASVNSKDYEIVAIGDVTQIGNRKLIEVEIKSLFTDKEYSFRVVERPKLAIDYVNMMYKLLNEKKPVRFVVTGDKTDINMLCSITNFKHSQKFGEEGEYYYTLSLKEYREYKTKRVIIQKPKVQQPKPVAQPVPQRPADPPKPRTHTVVRGDTLWGIAKKYYGNGSQYTKIFDANRDKIKNANLIYPNQVFVIP